jgi:hypothetical protein
MKWVDRWSVQSESDPTKFYTVARSEEGDFGCSCPQWKFRHIICKHIEGVSAQIIGMTPTETRTVNKLRFVSVMNHLKLSCDNCAIRNDWGGCSKGYIKSGDKSNLVFVKKDKKSFYILGRCCEHYEKDKNA